MGQQVEAELKRRDALNALVAWVLLDDADNNATGKSDPVIDQGTRNRLQLLVDALAPGGTASVDVRSFPADYPLPAVQLDLLAPPGDFPLPASQLTLLTPPGDYPLPAAQLTQLTPPANYPLPDAQLTQLTPPANGLTDDQLRQSPVNVDTGNQVARRVLLDYDGRTDQLPVYVGIAVQGTTTSQALWRIIRMTWDVDNRLVDKQELTDVVWDNRAALGWV